MNNSTQLTKTGIGPTTEDRFPLEQGNVRGSIVPRSYSYDADERRSQLREYWRTIRKHLWLIIGVSVLIPTLTAIYVLRKPDIFESQARIQVDLENSNRLLNGMSKTSPVVVNSEATDPAYFNTQLQILAGPGLLRRVAKNLDLEHNNDFLRDYPARDKSLWTSIRSKLGMKVPATSKSPSSDVLPVTSLPVTSSAPSMAEQVAEAERLADCVEDLQESLSVEPVKETRLTVRETRLIDISYRHSSPQLAAKIVNEIADSFIKSNSEKKSETTSSTSSYLNQRIAELQSKNKAKEEELINYGKDHKILSLDQNQNTVVERLVGLNKQLLIAENERKLAEAAYRASQQPGAVEALAEAGTSDRDVPSATKVATEAEIKLADLKRKRAELLVENTKEWPEVKEVEKQIASLEKQLNETKSRAASTISTNLATHYRQTLQAEETIRKAYDQQRAETLTQNEAAVNYRLIQQEIETNKSLLDGLLQRAKENDVVTAGTPNNIRVVDFAIPAKKPIAPRRTFIVGFAFLLSLALGIGLAFFIEYLDDSIRSSEDVENYIGLPSVAMIPLVGAAKQKRLGRSAAAKAGALATTNGNGTKEVLLTEVDKRSPVAEAYRHLRTSILLSTAGRPPRSLLITSSVPSEGKTTTAVNVAISLAQTGAKVLIIDADMRRPRLHSIFQLNNSQGLSSLLSSDITESDLNAVVQKVEGAGLYALTAGPVPPNPAELIGSEQMLKLISTVTAGYTHVIVDSPPVAAFTDGVLIGAMVDAVLLVVCTGKSSRKIIARAKRLLQEVGARIVGVVLNKMPTAGLGANSYYYSGYYQHYHYGPEPAVDES